MYYLRQKRLTINLLIMMVVWLVSSVDFYMINYLVNTFDEVYLCALAVSFSDFLAEALSAVIYPRLRARWSYFSYFSFSTVGGAIVLAYGLEHQDNWSFIVLIIIAKFGISSAINVVYIGHNDMFPPLFASAALGYCQMLARLFTSFSTLFAQLEEPVPMWIFTASAAVAAVLSLGLKPPEAQEEDKEGEKDSRRNSVLSDRSNK